MSLRLIALFCGITALFSTSAGAQEAPESPPEDSTRPSTEPTTEPDNAKSEAGEEEQEVGSSPSEQDDADTEQNDADTEQNVDAAEPAPAEAAAAPTTAPTSVVPLSDDAQADPPPPEAATAPQNDYENASSVPLDESRLQPQKKSPKDSTFILGITYDTALPLGNTRDYNKKFSGRGFSVSGRYRTPIGIRLGVSFGWQVFQEKLDTTITRGNATVGGVQVRETSVTPIVASVAYGLESYEAFTPYLRLAMGPGRVWRRLDIGIRRFVDETWHLAVIPELGVEIPVSRMLVLLGVRYNYFAKAGGAPSQSYMSFSAGLGFD